MQCGKCGKTGHLSAKCWQCNKCGRTGHTSAKCWHCDKCGRYGHQSAKCWKCTECEQYGHTVNRCPSVRQKQRDEYNRQQREKEWEMRQIKAKKLFEKLESHLTTSSPPLTEEEVVSTIAEMDEHYRDNSPAVSHNWEEVDKIVDEWMIITWVDHSQRLLDTCLDRVNKAKRAKEVRASLYMLNFLAKVIPMVWVHNLPFYEYTFPRHPNILIVAKDKAMFKGVVYYHNGLLHSELVERNLAGIHCFKVDTMGLILEKVSELRVKVDMRRFIRVDKEPVQKEDDKPGPGWIENPTKQELLALMGRS